MKAHYANHLDAFAKTKIDYQGETNKAETTEVRMLVIRPNDKIPVNFRLLQESQGWMIQKCSYDALVRCMKDRLKTESGGR